MALNTTTKVFTIAEPNTETLGALLSQLGSLLGVGPRADGRLHLADMCVADGVNIWSKRKPINSNKEANITDDEIDLYNYGLRQDPDTFYYYWVKPTTWKRLRDFDGYNHKAIPPIKNTEHLSGTKSFIGGGQVVLNPSDIMATGSNVEIPLARLGFVFDQGYVGIAFINRRNKKGWVNSTDYKLSDVINNNSNVYSIGFALDGAPNVSDGDVIDAYFCLTPTPEWFNSAYSDNAGVEIMCCDAKHGHWEIKAKKMTLSQISIADPTIYKSYSGYNATFTGCNFYLYCSFPFSELANDGTAGDNMTFELYINNSLLGSTSLFVNSSRKDVTISNGSVTVDSDTLRDDNYLVDVWVRGKFTSQSTWSTFFRGSYNVQSSSYE